MATHKFQRVPIRLYRTNDLLVIDTPLPGLEAEDILVMIAGDHVTIYGEQRGPRQDDRPLLVDEWAIGPYECEVVLPAQVDGSLANASYGNGVLVLSMPTVAPGQTGVAATFRLDAHHPGHGERVGHQGRAIIPTTTEEHRQRLEGTGQK